MIISRRQTRPIVILCLIGQLTSIMNRLSQVAPELESGAGASRICRQLPVVGVAAAAGAKAFNFAALNFNPRTPEGRNRPDGGAVVLRERTCPIRFDWPSREFQRRDHQFRIGEPRRMLPALELRAERPFVWLSRWGSQPTGRLAARFIIINSATCRSGQTITAPQTGAGALAEAEAPSPMERR